MSTTEQPAAASHHKLVSPIHHPKLMQWIEEISKLCTPDEVRWCNGSEEEWNELCQQLVDQGTFTRLNAEKHPNSFLARTDPEDVARVEERTFICSNRAADAGPTNNWVNPAEMRATLREKIRWLYGRSHDVHRTILYGTSR